MDFIKQSLVIGRTKYLVEIQRMGSVDRPEIMVVLHKHRTKTGLMHAVSQGCALVAPDGATFPNVAPSHLVKYQRAVALIEGLIQGMLAEAAA